MKFMCVNPNLSLNDRIDLMSEEIKVLYEPELLSWLKQHQIDYLYIFNDEDAQKKINILTSNRAIELNGGKHSYSAYDVASEEFANHHTVIDINWTDKNDKFQSTFLSGRKIEDILSALEKKIKPNE